VLPWQVSVFSVLHLSFVGTGHPLVDSTLALYVFLSSVSQNKARSAETSGQAPARHNGAGVFGSFLAFCLLAQSIHPFDEIRAT
jgi:hypothetical protein